MAAMKECYQAAFESGPAALIVRLPRSKLKVIHANTRACALLEKTKEELEKQELNSTVKELATPELLSLYQQASKREMDELVDIELPGGIVTVSAEGLGGTAVLIHLCTKQDANMTDGEVEDLVLGKRKRTDSEAAEGGGRQRVSLEDVKTSNQKASILFQRLRDGEDVSGEELTAVLLSLVAAGDVLPVQAALEHGANANVSSPFTPLYAAVKMGNVEIVKALLRHGASMVQSNEGQPGECPLRLVLRMSQRSPIAVIFNHELHEIDRIRKELLEIEKRKSNDGGEPSSPYRGPR